MRVETTGRVVEVVEGGGLGGVLVELDTSGEVWLPLEAVTVVEPEPVNDADPISLATHRAVRQLRDWTPPDTAGY